MWQEPLATLARATVTAKALELSSDRPVAVSVAGERLATVGPGGYRASR
jgi:hypothetical protein